MTIRFAIGICAMALLAVACRGDKKQEEKQTGNPVTISGKVGFPQKDQWIVISQLLPDNNVVKRDSVQVGEDFTYSKTVLVPEPAFYQINFFNQQLVNVILNKTNLEVNVDGNAPGGFSEIKGSAEHEFMNEVRKRLSAQQNNPAVAALEAEFQQAVQQQNEKKITELQERYLAISQASTDSLAAFVARQPASLAVMEVLQANLLDSDQYYEIYRETAARLKSELPNSPYITEFVTRVKAMEATAVGQVAPEISLPNPDGQVISLSSLRGQYVLVDFWAKWCGPCRRENPNVVKAYTKYKNKGFTVFGVSLDRTKEDWVKAIAEDGLTWTHVSDLKYFESQAARDYNINAIPFSLLLDREGKIIAKNLRGPALEKKLEEVFSTSAP
jgi:peroxiredoxin